MKGLQLLATGGALPSRVVTNEDLRRQVDTSDEWITTRTGICQRYYCTENEDAATLAITAARQALTRSGLAANDIACCVVATLSAPTATPSIACRVQAALGLPENRPAFDVNAACSGFIYAAAAAHGLLSTLGGRPCGLRYRADHDGWQGGFPLCRGGYAALSASRAGPQPKDIV